MEHVVLVDEKDNELGTMGKMDAHQNGGTLHRAFSVLLFNTAGELLLQKRAADKYHSAGLWTNTCCSHPLQGESIEDAAQRRLSFEMGIDLRPELAFKFLYKVQLDNGITEHELDHVLVGTFDGEPSINKSEVEDWKFASLHFIREDIKQNPDAYSHWFKIIVDHPSLMNALA